jgi:hypothetical protein
VNLKNGNKTIVEIIKEYHFYQFHTNITQYTFLDAKLTQTKLSGIMSEGFDMRDNLLLRILNSPGTGERMEVQWNSTPAIHRLQE